MCAGKTSEMVRRASQYFFVTGKKALLVTCDLDTRNPTERLSSHFPFFANLNELFDIVTFGKDELRQVNTLNTSKYSCVCIDETQFFTDLWNVINELTRHNIVICSGLNSDYRKKPFGEFNELFSLADEKVECRAHCVLCLEQGKFETATHTKRKVSKQYSLSEDTVEIEIGGVDVYEPVCSTHWI